MLDFNDSILSYPLDDEVLFFCTRSIERFEGGEFPIPIFFFDLLCCCWCIGCDGTVGVDVDGWILCQHVVDDDGAILFHRDDGREVYIGETYL